MTMTFNSDYAKYGFDKFEIEKFLENHGINAPINPPDLVSKHLNVPAWVEELRAKEIFSVWQAASILIGVNPYSQEYRDLEYDERFTLAKDLLDEAVSVGKLNVLKKDGQDAFQHKDLRAWAISIKRGWCIPPMTEIRSQELASFISENDDVVLKRLKQSERENAGLQDEKTKLAESLTKAQETLTLQNQQLTDATDRLADSVRANTNFQTEFDSLKADALAGKSNTAMLNVIGGLLEIILNQNIPKNVNQEWVMKVLLETHPSATGLSRANLSKLFPKAKKSIEGS